MSDFRIEPLPSGKLARSTVVFSAEDFSLDCQLTYPDPAPPPLLLSDRLALSFGITPVRAVLTMGELTLMMNAQGRIASIDVYTNHVRWEAAELADVSTEAGVVRVTGTPDANGHYGGGADIQRATHDARQAVIAFTWQPAQRWVRIADHVAIGLAPNAGTALALQLAELRIGGVYRVKA